MNSDEELSQPPAKQPKLQTIHEISALADVDLAAIFKHLPPYDRLLVSEVCKRWHAISRQAWPDIVHLDFSEIPGPNIAAVIKQSPNLRRVTAERKSVDLKELNILSQVNLSSLKLHGCAFDTRITEQSRVGHPMATYFPSNFHTAPWDELVVHNLAVTLAGSDPGMGLVFPAFFPASLKRLQISGSGDPHLPPLHIILFCPLRDQLNQLECLILLGATHSASICGAFMAAQHLGVGAVVSLANLRELLLSFDHGYHLEDVLKLAKLETLFLHNTSTDFTESEDFSPLATKHPTLRILVLTGSFHAEIEFPPRVLCGNGFNAPPLPQLHIFVGRRASTRIRFPKLPSDAAKVYPITEPLPQFLEREDIKPIFKDCWIAEKIRDVYKSGSKLFKYEWDVATSLQVTDN